MKRLSLNRRAFLRGAGTAAVALPFLEIMGNGKPSGAQAATPPVRYLVNFAGVALATDATVTPYVLPKSTGMDYLSSLLRSPANSSSPNVNGLSPLADMNLGSDVTLLSNLQLPSLTGAAHWGATWHPPTVRPLLSGMSSSETNLELSTPTSDLLAAQKLGPGALFQHLALRAQPVKYRFSETGNNAVAGGRLSANANGPIEPFIDPGQVYDQLFGVAPPTANPTPMGDLGAREDRRVVDIVLAHAQRLRARLGMQDQQRLDQHLQELRDFELRLAGLTGAGAACTPPAKPQATFPSEMTDRSGWSNETLRAQLMNDLMYMAFACDLTRAGSLMYTYASSYTATDNILGHGGGNDIHEVTHSAGDAEQGSDLAMVWNWHVGHWAYLLNKLKSTPEANGSLLDNCMVVFLNEAGYGVQQGAQADLNSEYGAHSGNNMMVMLAGRAGGRFTPKGHVDGAQAHPTQVILSAMKAVGVDGPLGEITQAHPALG